MYKYYTISCIPVDNTYMYTIQNRLSYITLGTMNKLPCHYPNITLGIMNNMTM